MAQNSALLTAPLSDSQHLSVREAGSDLQLAAECLDVGAERREVDVIHMLDTRNVRLRDVQRVGDILLCQVTPLAERHAAREELEADTPIEGDHRLVELAYLELVGAPTLS